MSLVAAFHFAEARQCVLDRVSASRRMPPLEEVELLAASGRVLAEDVAADRDYPPTARSIRDGFAVRSSSVSGELTVVGEVRAGERVSGFVNEGEAIEIMTGATVPAGADAVVMVEHVTRKGSWISTSRAAAPGQFINPQGSEAKAGEILLRAGRRIGFAEVAMLATVGCFRVRTYRRPEVSILATGDEIVGMHEKPLEYQIRNSNAYSLAVQVIRAGGIPRLLPVARDNEDSTRELIEEGLKSDLLLLSGGVSAGKYDVVERVFASLGAEFHFDRVLIQPGQPLVFGTVSGRFFFGLPGNPASTMVTFELFGRAAVELLAGQSETLLPIFWSQLTVDFRHKTGLTRFLPASLSADGSRLTPIPWQGSSDVAALSRANAFLVADANRESWAAGEMMKVLLK